MATNFIWKYSWNTLGHPLETITLDATGIPLGTLVKLPHTYYRSNGFVADYLGTDNMYHSLTSGEDSPLSRADICWAARDGDLSNSAGASIYSRIKINTPRAASKLRIKVSFVADAFDPSDFGQSLNATSDVIHNSLTVKEKVSAKELNGSVISDFMSGSWGIISGASVQFSSSVYIGSSKLTADEVVFESPTIAFGTLVLSSKDENLFVKDSSYIKPMAVALIEELKDTSYIPVIHADRPARLRKGILYSVAEDRMYMTSAQFNQIILSDTVEGIEITKVFVTSLVNRIEALERKVSELQKRI